MGVGYVDDGLICKPAKKSLLGIPIVLFRVWLLVWVCDVSVGYVDNGLIRKSAKKSLLGIPNVLARM